MSTLPDLVNGAFESFGALAILLSVRKLYRDKVVRGFHWGQLTFFTAWGLWNLYYYPHLGQWASFLGGVAVVLMNTVYLGMIVYYTRKEEGGEHALDDRVS